MAIRIEQQTRVVASGDYCTVEFNHATGKVTLNSITLANADELEAFGEALVDVADMLRSKVQQPSLEARATKDLMDTFNETAADASAKMAAKTVGIL